jgi:hypothetical protein
MKIVSALVVALSVVGVAHAEQLKALPAAHAQLLKALPINAAHAQQLKALPINSYVLTDPDGTPQYLVQYSEESKTRKVYHVVKPVEQENSSPPQRGNRSRRSTPEKRVNSKQSWEQFNRKYGFTEM